MKHVAALLKRSAWEEGQRGIQLNCWMWMRPACAYLGAVLAHVGAVVGDLGVAVGNERDLHVLLQVLDRRVERSDRKLGAVGAKALQVVVNLFVEEKTAAALSVSGWCGAVKRLRGRAPSVAASLRCGSDFQSIVLTSTGR